MIGTCENCKNKNMNINPYIDSPYYRWCFACQIGVQIIEPVQEKLELRISDGGRT